MVFTPRCDVYQYFDNLEAEGIAVCKLCKQRMKNVRRCALRKHLRKLHSAKSEIWNYFNNVVEEGVAVCKRCKQCVRNNHSSFLTKHMEEAHNIFIYDIEEAARKREKNNTTNSSQSLVNYTDDDCTQLSGNDFGTKIDHKNDGSAQTSSYNLRKKVQNYAENTQMSDQTSHDYDDHITESSEVMVNDLEEVNEQRLIRISNVNELPIEICRTVIPQESVNHPLVLSIPKSVAKRVIPDKNESVKKAKKHLCINIDEKTVTSAVWGLMVDEGIAPAIFGSKNMQAILQPIYEAISENENKEFKIDEAESERVLCLVSNKLRNDFSNELDWRLLSLKIDTDVNGPANTFCVSTTFVHGGCIQTRFLGIVDLMDDVQLTEQHIKQVLHKFNIDSNQIIHICWDNTKAKFNSSIKNSDYLKEIEKFEEYPDIQFGEIKLQRYVGIIAQLCLLDILKDMNIFESFLECRKMAKFISDESNGYYNTFLQNNLSIPELDSPWKLGSTYNMINSLYEASNILKCVKYPKLENPEDQFNVNDDLWVFMSAFVKSLGFLQKTIIKFYNEEMHFGDFYAQWLKTKLLIIKHSYAENDNNYTTTITEHLLKSIETRSKELLDQNFFIACLYLDPRFHHIVAEQEKVQVVKYLKCLWNRSKIYNVDVINAATESQEEFVKSRFDNDEDAFLNEFLCQDVQQIDSKTTEVFNKIEGIKLPFKSVDTNILSFWHKHESSNSEMYSLSAICFAIPTTQNYFQQRYTHIYQNVHISKMSTFTKNNLLIVRLNSDLLGDVLKHFGILSEV